jgi:hypothetical protein
MGNWSADISKDPYDEDDYRLCIELWEDEHHRGCIRRLDNGNFVLHIYAGGDITIPADWLRQILQHFEQELGSETNQLQE